MFGRIVVVGAAVIAAELGWLCLSERSADRADFTYVNPSGLHTLDPARMSWTQDFRVALNLWEGLSTWHPETLQPIAGAALLPPKVSTDGRTYRFTIRPEARWSNGDRVTAGDFVRGWRRGMEPGTAADYTFLFTDHIAGAHEYVRWRRDCVAALSTATPPAGAFERCAAELDTRFAAVGVRAADDATLIVELARPCPYFLDLTAFPTFVPCHESIEALRERHRGAEINAQGLVVYDPQWTKPDYRRDGYPGLVTNGPYQLAEWTFKRRARLQANPYFHGATSVSCRTIDMLEYESVAASLLAYEAGEVDFLTDLSVPYDHEIARLARIGERPDFQTTVLLATYFLNFNCLSPTVAERENPFRDRRIRKAFTLATDREALVEKVRRRGDRAARTFIPPASMPGYPSPRGLAFDPQQAQALLAEAGFPGGVGLPPVELLYVSSDERICQAIARMWEDTLGVRVELRSQESKTFAEEKTNHRFMIARANWYGDYNDPTTFLNCLLTGNGNNDSGYSSARFDTAMRAAEEATDAARRADLLREAEAIAIEEDCPILPILHYAETVAVKPYVRGLRTNPRLWFPFRYVSVDR